MSMANVSVDTTSGGVSVLAKNGNRRAALIKAPIGNTATVYVKFDSSATALTTSNGYPLEPGDELILAGRSMGGSVGDKMPGGTSEHWCEVKAIVATGTQNLRVVELGDS